MAVPATGDRMHPRQRVRRNPGGGRLKAGCVHEGRWGNGEREGGFKIQGPTPLAEQSGVLTNTEVSLLLKLSPSTVGTYRREWEEEHQRMLPTRGSIHDMGPTLTHKKIILQKLIFEGKNVQSVCRETDHSPEAVLRYTTNFKQVLMCKGKGLDVAQTSFATKLSPRLIEEYLDLIEEYRQRYANLPNGKSSHLDEIVKKLDQSTNPSHPITTPNP
jgi:hypothetical protein